MLTVLSALKAQVQYPLPGDFFNATLVKRELDGEVECTKEIIDSPKFIGAHADCIKQLVMFPNSISEGGMSISKADRESLMSLANTLYKSIGEATIGERAKITFY